MKYRILPLKNYTYFSRENSELLWNGLTPNQFQQVINKLKNKKKK